MIEEKQAQTELNLLIATFTVSQVMPSYGEPTNASMPQLPRPPQRADALCATLFHGFSEQVSSKPLRSALLVCGLSAYGQGPWHILAACLSG